jgi:hypothetical protein
MRWRGGSSEGVLIPAAIFCWCPYVLVFPRLNNKKNIKHVQHAR